MSAPPPNLVLATGPQPTVIIATFTVPASSAVGTIVQAQVAGFGPLVGSQTTIVIPITEVWHVVRMSIVGAPTAADATLLTFVSGYIQNIQPTLSILNINLLQPFQMPQSIPLGPGTTFASSISLLAASPSSSTVQTVQYQVVRAPYTG